MLLYINNFALECQSNYSLNSLVDGFIFWSAVKPVVRKIQMPLPNYVCSTSTNVTAKVYTLEKDRYITLYVHKSIVIYTRRKKNL